MGAPVTGLLALRQSDLARVMPQCLASLMVSAAAWLSTGGRAAEPMDWVLSDCRAKPPAPLFEALLEGFR